MLRRFSILLGAATLAACQPPPPREALDPHELRIQLQQLAADLQLVVSRIAGAQDDPPALQALRHELSGLAAQARRIADGDAH